MIDWVILSAPGTEIYHNSMDLFAETQELDANADQLNEVESIFQRVKSVYEKLDNLISTEAENVCNNMDRFCLVFNISDFNIDIIYFLREKIYLMIRFPQFRNLCPLFQYNRHLKSH